MKIKIKSSVVSDELKIEWEKLKNKLIQSVDCCEFIVYFTVIAVIMLHIILINGLKHPQINSDFKIIKNLQDKKILEIYSSKK